MAKITYIVDKDAITNRIIIPDKDLPQTYNSVELVDKVNIGWVKNGNTFISKQDKILQNQAGKELTKKQKLELATILKSIK